MEINRNQYFLAGLVILGLGLQLRLVDSYVLNEPCSQFLAKRLKKAEVATTGSVSSFIAAPIPVPRQTVRPPTWLGWAMLSAGGVLVLHSLAMRRPG